MINPKPVSADTLWAAPESGMLSVTPPAGPPQRCPRHEHASLPDRRELRMLAGPCACSVRAALRVSPQRHRWGSAAAPA